MIQYYILAVIFGLGGSFLIHNYLSKREDKMISSNAVDKIMKQDLDFVVDGNKIDLKGDVKKGYFSSGIPVKVPEKPKEVKPIIKLKEKKKVKKKR